MNGATFPFKTVLLAAVAIAALVGLAMYAASLSLEQWLARIGLSLILGGAAGNLIDRVTAGYVVDFVDLYYARWHFWAFNVADAAITVGVALMILDLLGVGARDVSRAV
jgi:signal peptidase II